MREIHRTIVSALIFSQDGKLLLGRKDPASGGVYPDCWHLPGGGVEEGQSFEKAIVREVKEEVGLDLSPYKLKQLPYVDSGVSEKILSNTGEKVLCHMEFNKFKVVIEDKLAKDIALKLDDDLIEARWFDKQELKNIEQVPGSKELLTKLGIL